MQRPSNLIIAFILAITTTFVVYALSRMAIKIFQVPTVEVTD